jgi:Fe-S cluster assembly protein SufD
MVQAMSTSVRKDADGFLEQFQRFERQAKHPSWVFPLRKAGIARFAELGFPTVDEEDWRFTNVAPIARLPFKPVLERTGEAPDADDISRFPFGQLAAIRLVFINGHYAKELSSQPPPAEGITIRSLSEALASNLPTLEQHFGRYAAQESNSFAALNTAFFQDGAFIRIEAGRQLQRPVHLLYISTVKETGAAFHPRNLIIAEENSQATIVESYAATQDAACFTNAVTELVAGEKAVLEHVKFQDETPSAFHIAAIYARLGRHSNVVLHSIATGAKLSRNNIRATLAGEGLECILNGLYLTGGSQLADHHMVVEHAQPNCRSHEYFNGILDGRSKGVFHGRILVRPAGQKTDAKQTNKNLLLSDEATVDTKPQLEIYADDVKCTHGATIGQLNEESIFYLRSRGIGAERARRMLIHAFAAEILERIRHAPAREELSQRIWNHLEANPHLANSK